jgi:hypothetical protein
MHRGIISLVLSTCLVATAMVVAAWAQSAPATKGPETKSPPPPIVFYVAKGEPGACGPGCREWIAAEGFIDPMAEPRLWELLRKIGNDRKLPVYFHSGGGSVTAGLQIGRLLRGRGLTAGVGWTVPVNCDRQNPGAAACDELKRSGRELPAELDTRAGVCASSCVYTILGGVVRDVAAGARLGIHDTSMPPTIKSFDELGHIVDRPLQLSTEKERSALAAGQQAIAVYLKEMGISPDLLTAAHAVSADKLHVLTREEIVAFGIDRRETVESAWSLAEKPPGVSAVKLIEARDGRAFRRAMLSVTCRDTSTVRLQYMHEVGGETDGSPAALRVTAGGRSFPLRRIGSAAQDGNRTRVESHGADLPLATLDAAAFVIETSGSSDQSPDTSAALPIHVAVQGAAPALGALARRCGSGAR